MAFANTRLSSTSGGRGDTTSRYSWLGTRSALLGYISLGLVVSLLCGQAQGLLGNDEGVDIKDLDEGNVERLLKFVLTEIQKLKVENRELDDCHGLEIGSVLRGKKQTQKTVTYSLTLKVQPTDLVSDECSQRNSTSNSLHPEICEAEVIEDEKGGTSGMTLLRSACLQVEELQD